MTFGRYFEEFEVGQTYNHFPGRTITAGDHMLFSMLTMNHHPLHIDANLAAQTQHGRPLVVGTLVFSLIVGLSVPDISGHAVANLEYSEVKHHAPSFVEDTLYARSTILAKRLSNSKPERGIVSVETQGFNQERTLVLSFKRKVLIPTRAAGPAGGGFDFWETGV